MELSKITTIVPKLLDWVSFKRVVTVFSAAVLGTAGITLFEHRSTVFELFVKTDAGPVVSAVTVSDKMKQRIKEMTDQSTDIVVTGVISADLRTNQRFPVFYYSKTPAVTQLLEEVRKQLGSSQTIFSSNVANNARMVSVINGEFGCGAMSDTLMARVVPALTSHLKTFCLVGLPPYYGDFRGYVIIFTDKQLSTEMTDAVRLETVKLANDVYQEQLNKSVGPVKQ
jgi:hypothetical protein